VKENLANYKTPREVVFLDELPRNPTGKVIKRELLEQDSDDAEGDEAGATADDEAGATTGDEAGATTGDEAGATGDDDGAKETDAKTTAGATAAEDE
jgi:hypothetical protein